MIRILSALAPVSDALQAAERLLLPQEGDYRVYLWNLVWRRAAWSKQGPDERRDPGRNEGEDRGAKRRVRRPEGDAKAGPGFAELLPKGLSTRAMPHDVVRVSSVRGAFAFQAVRAAASLGRVDPP